MSKTRSQVLSLKDHQEKEEYLRVHLYSELLWLLHAATEWSIQDQWKLEIAGYVMQVYALDSASLHARTLFEFFTEGPTKHHYSVKDFLGAPLTSTYKQNWQGPLHGFLMHAQNRSLPRPLVSAGVSKDLNQMPVDFAHEILRLWKEFEDQLGKSSNADTKKLQQLARDKREEATRKAMCVSKAATSGEVAEKYFQKKGQQLKPVFS